MTNLSINNTVYTVSVADEMGVVSTVAAQFAVPGAGMPSGGTTNQALTKVSNTDYDYTWTTLSGTYSDEQAQDAVGGMVDSSLVYVDGTPLLQRAALTGNVTAAAGSNATTIAAGVVTEAMQVLADNTTNNVTTTKHGYAPKAPNDATKFLDGTGAWTVPASGGSAPRVISSIATNANPVTITNGAVSNFLSVSLPAGTWLVMGNWNLPSGGFATYYNIWIDTISSTFPTTDKSYLMGSSTITPMLAPTRVFTFATTTTVYLSVWIDTASAIHGQLIALEVI